jgi:hypothetical protein
MKAAGARRRRDQVRVVGTYSIKPLDREALAHARGDRRLV